MAEPTLARIAMVVLHKWHTDSQYLGPSHAAPNRIQGLSGRNFRSLVSSVDPNVSAGLVLDELLRGGSVVYWVTRIFVRFLAHSWRPGLCQQNKSNTFVIPSLD